MRRRLAAAIIAAAALAAAHPLRAEQASPRDLWPQALASARDGDYADAAKKTSDLLTAGHAYGVKTYPVYATAAAGLARESAKATPELSAWAAKAAHDLDPASPSVAFSEADRAAAHGEWGKALPLVAQGFARVFGNYRARTLGHADLLLVVALAIALTTVVFAIALFFRYGRSAAHDFRELLGTRVHGGSVTVLAFAMLFLPLFLWLGPMWLIFYWLAIFFGYAAPAERVVAIVLLLLVALVPIVVDADATGIAGIDSPVMQAAIASNEQSYQPEAMRRLQELLAIVPDNATLHLLLGNLQSFDGMEEQAAQHYRRAIELRKNYAGAHVNLGNLHFLTNEFPAAITEYEQAQADDPKLAIAYYNASVADGETYKFDQQARMLEKARGADPGVIDRLTRNPPPQKIVMYHPPLDEAWAITRELSQRKELASLFGNYAQFAPAASALNPVTLGALASLLLAVVLWLAHRRGGYANACIKCGRTFCHRCKSARESSTYCTQCIHIYLKRDGVSLDTKRKKLEEVTEHHSGMQTRNRVFATFLPGSAQMLEGRTASGAAGMFVFALLVATAIFIGRLAPAIGPVADVAHLIVRIGAVALAVVLWLTMSLPVYRRRVTG
ncbi:MAG: tetratricopeptide repeat protein [Acidobacteria bacterium]|nr:tetratricopeptide repeat protein [Acidobacteriota bacterium]MBV9070803.1 tetratricopeptide repeat protein [Acidobacteriota bacterium]MBV9475337.1 tetratricopeptide repeat protein [Acidobacteriota bacterium]